MSPRKYHRPPTAATTKRRKTRKIPYEFQGPDEAAVEADGDEMTEGDDGDDSEDAPMAGMRAVPQAEAPTAAAMRSGITGKAERHVSVDYSYVRGEVIRIVAIVSFLVIALIITSFFR